VNLKSYNLVNKELSAAPSLTEIPEISFKIDDNKDAYLFTNLGNSIKMRVQSIPECKFREKGINLFDVVKNVQRDERIVGMLELDNAVKDANLIFVTKNGMVKVSKVSEFIVSKQLISAIKLGKNDEIIYVDFHNPNKKLSLFTANGCAVKVDTDDIAVSGRVGLGVKGIALDKQDYVVGAMQTAISDAFALFTSDGRAKIIKQSEVGDSARNRKGLSVISAKTKDVKLVFAGRLSTKVNYVISSQSGKLLFAINSSLPLDTRLGSGKIVTKEKIIKVYPFTESK
jgi:DNA gyrase/topoisomerase IV subunit A